MKQLLRLGIILVFLVAPLRVAAQNILDSQDPRQLALDIYVDITRGVEPATIALKLEQVIEIFRYSCTRVTDYQVFAQRPNITDLKVKCSGASLYGVTLASNGYVAVYGGNQIVASLDRRDGLIFSFGAAGDLSGTSAVDIDRVKEETRARFLLGGEYDYIYLIAMLVILVVMAVAIGLVFLRLWRHRKRKRKTRGRMKPMKKFTARKGNSGLKDRLLAESEEIAKYVHKHESGIYIAVGKRGKRRLFKSAFWAKRYAHQNIHFNELTDAELAKMDFGDPVEIEDIAEGDEYQMPGENND